MVKIWQDIAHWILFRWMIHNCKDVEGYLEEKFHIVAEKNILLGIKVKIEKLRFVSGKKTISPWKKINRGVGISRVTSIVKTPFKHGVNEKLGYSHPLFQKCSFQFLKDLWKCWAVKTPSKCFKHALMDSCWENTLDSLFVYSFLKEEIIH